MFILSQTHIVRIPNIHDLIKIHKVIKPGPKKKVSRTKHLIIGLLYVFLHYQASGHHMTCFEIELVLKIEACTFDWEQ